MYCSSLTPTASDSVCMAHRKALLCSYVFFRPCCAPVHPVPPQPRTQGKGLDGQQYPLMLLTAPWGTDGGRGGGRSKLKTTTD